MFNVRSAKAIRRLVHRSFYSNRLRNRIASAAIALTTLLFTALFTLGIGGATSVQNQSMRMAGGAGHAALKYMTQAQYERVRASGLYAELSYDLIAADSVDNPGLRKRRGEFYCMDETAMRLGFCTPTEGRIPVTADEIAMDTLTMQLLGVPQEIGAPVTLQLTVHGVKVERAFSLSGWWEQDPVFNVSKLIASPAYAKAHADEIFDRKVGHFSYAGKVNSYVMFPNTWNLQGQLDALMAASGLSYDPQDAAYVASNLNWSYLTTGMAQNPELIWGAAAGLLLIGLTGYLIIFNIFEISVLRDIRFYGLLKTLGATGRQIRGLIRRQAMLLCVVGIPVGLLAGFFLGCVLAPHVLSSVARGAVNARIEPSPLIFIGSAFFSLATVCISARKPGRIAALVSPVEAVRYVDGACATRARRKRGAGGGKIWRMALSNLGRNKRRTALTLLSLSLSLVLLCAVFTLTSGFDLDKFIALFVGTDFLIAHADFFAMQYRGSDSALTEKMIEAVQAQPGFVEGGRLYADTLDRDRLYVLDPENTAPINQEEATGVYICAVYGLEDLPLGRLKVLEGEIDLQKLRTGAYILEGIHMEDDGTPSWEGSRFDIGETVTLIQGGGSARDPTERTFTVMAKVAVETYINSDQFHWEYTFYLPAQVYLPLIDAPGLMSYAFNVSQGSEASMEAFLAEYSRSEDPMMAYRSKQTYLDEFDGVKRLIEAIGCILSFVIGGIGLLNFVNSMLTSVIARRGELALLRCIGMTARQLRAMLCLEGVLYALMTMAFSLVLGLAVSFVLVRGLGSFFWFFTYRFILWPLIAPWPALLAFGALMPIAALRLYAGKSAVEGLREVA